MKKSKILMILGSLLPLSLFFLPLWNITLEAPQYPIPLGMDIYISKFADYHEHDIKNINLMNHYVGMKYIPETIPEFKIFPLVIGIMAVLGVIIGFLGKHKLFLAWFILMSLLCIAGMYDFYLWEYDYGHDLDPKAIMSFKNPDGTPNGFSTSTFWIKGHIKFYSAFVSRPGGYVLFVGILLTFVAFLVGRKEAKRSNN